MSTQQETPTMTPEQIFREAASEVPDNSDLCALECCPECGCLDVQVESWIHANTGAACGETGSSDWVWCPTCEENGRRIARVKLVDGKVTHDDEWCGRACSCAPDLASKIHREVSA